MRALTHGSDVKARSCVFCLPLTQCPQPRAPLRVARGCRVGVPMSQLVTAPEAELNPRLRPLLVVLQALAVAQSPWLAAGNSSGARAKLEELLTTRTDLRVTGGLL